MLVIRGHGRFGNLMFQHSAVMSVAEINERVIFIDFRKILQFLPGLESSGHFVDIPSRFFPLAHRTEIFLNALGAARIIGRVSYDFGARALRRTRGLFPVTFFAEPYAQDERVLDFSRARNAFLESLDDDEITSSRASFLARGKSGSPRCFVHIRRTDYLTWPSVENPAAPPLRWFKEQMDQLRKSQPGMLFFLFTDDPEGVQAELAHKPDTILMNEPDRKSWFLMATCDAGILSPSTYGWWAGYFAALASSGPFIAPTNWSSWSLREPSKNQLANSSFLTYERPALDTIS